MTMEEEMDGQSEPSQHYQEEGKNIQQQTTSYLLYVSRKKASNSKKEE